MKLKNVYCKFDKSFGMWKKLIENINNNADAKFKNSDNPCS